MSVPRAHPESSLRCDHVGSLLRPPALLAARDRLVAGGLDARSFKRVEDEAVREVVALQEAAGCAVVTDGELRRESFQSELTAAVAGFEGVGLQSWLWGDWHSDELGDKRVERPAQAAVVAPLERRRTLAAAPSAASPPRSSATRSRSQTSAPSSSSWPGRPNGCGESRRPESRGPARSSEGSEG